MKIELAAGRKTRTKYRKPAQLKLKQKLNLKLLIEVTLRLGESQTFVGCCNTTKVMAYEAIVILLPWDETCQQEAQGRYEEAQPRNGR